MDITNPNTTPYILSFATSLFPLYDNLRYEFRCLFVKTDAVIGRIMRKTESAFSRQHRHISFELLKTGIQEGGGQLEVRDAFVLIIKCLVTNM